MKIHAILPTRVNPNPQEESAGHKAQDHEEEKEIEEEKKVKKSR